MALNFLNDGYFAGKVGIGTASPGGKLDINYGGTGGTGTFGIGEGLNITSLTPNITFNDLSSNVDNYAIHLNQNIFTLGRYTSATSQIPDLVLKAGNVGIGTTNPSSGKLVVKGDNYVITNSGKSLGGIDLRTNANPGAGLYTGGISFGGASTGRAAISGVQSPSGNDGDRQGLAFFTHGSGTGAADAAEAMRIQSNGNVGIGETNPAVPLHISRDSASGENIALMLDNNNTTAGNEIGILFRSMVGSGNTDFEIFGKANAANDMDLVFESDGSNERMRITSSGIFMVGGTTGGYAGTKIHVGNFTDSQNGINILTSTTGYGYILFGDGTGADTYVGQISYYHGDNSLAIRTNANERLKIDGNGAIKFNSYDSTNNTGTPTYLLGTDASGNVVKVLGGDIPIAAPAAPSTVTSTIVGETIEIEFNQSSTSNIDYYQVWSSDDGGDYGIIGQIAPVDFSSTMTVVDTTFVTGGTMSYRVYAVKTGIYSSAATTSKSYTVSALSVTAMTVVNLNTAYYIQYEKPVSRFIDHIEIYMDSQATQAALNRSNASIVYSGQNASYMRNVNASNNFHQFWVEVVTS